MSLLLVGKLPVCLLPLQNGSLAQCLLLSNLGLNDLME